MEQVWKIIENVVENGAKNHERSIKKSMLEKGMQKVWKIMPKWSQNGDRNHSKIGKIPEKRHAENDAENCCGKKKMKKSK